MTPWDTNAASFSEPSSPPCLLPRAAECEFTYRSYAVPTVLPFSRILGGFSPCACNLVVCQTPWFLLVPPYWRRNAELALICTIREEVVTPRVYKTIFPQSSGIVSVAQGARHFSIPLLTILSDEKLSPMVFARVYYPPPLTPLISHLLTPRVELSDPNYHPVDLPTTVRGYGFPFLT